MFTGIVQGTAELLSVEEKDSFRTHIIRMPEALLTGLELGASVAHNGCCLTVTAIDGDRVSFDLIHETLRITNLGMLKPGDKINVERAARFSDEIGGHVMSGHIMTKAEVSMITHSENNRTIWLTPHEEILMKYILHKGFVGVEGVSLTTGDVESDKFSVHLIPETLERTTLGAKRLGDYVNLEIDYQTQAIVDTVERVLVQREKNTTAGP